VFATVVAGVPAAESIFTRLISPSFGSSARARAIRYQEVLVELGVGQTTNSRGR
jgi:hypothetical protein